jgi:TolB-like protein
MPVEEEEKSIAVLPFTNLSGDESIEYISDGMTDEIISQLTKIKAFRRVIPATTMMSYKKTDKSVMEIAGELGVTHLLEGNVQKAGDTVKIVLRLIDGKSNTYNWSDNFKSAWQMEDLFRMQTEVAENLARNMNVSLSSEDRASLKQLPTISSEAYMLYRQAEYQRVRWDYQGFQNAIPLYEEAISLDPNYIEALMGLAYIWMVQGLWWGTLDENRAWTKSRELLQKILRMDPSNKEAEFSLYMGYFYYDWNFEIVEPYFQHHRTLRVFGDWSGLGDYAQKTGRWEEALRITEAFIDWEPMVGKHYIEKANILQNLGRTEEASALLQHTDLLYSDNFYYLRGSALVHYELKEYKESRNQLDIIFNRFIDRPPEVLWLNAIILIQEGRQRESQEQLHEIRQRYEKGAGGSPAYFIALYYFTLKDYDSGFEWLEKSYERHEVEMTRLMESQVLVSVAQDPRYKELWHKVGFSKVIKS